MQTLETYILSNILDIPETYNLPSTSWKEEWSSFLQKNLFQT